MNWGRVSDSVTGDIFHYEIHPMRGKLDYLNFESQESWGYQGYQTRNYTGVLDAGNKIVGSISAKTYRVDFKITF